MYQPRYRPGSQGGNWLIVFGALVALFALMVICGTLIDLFKKPAPPRSPQRAQPTTVTVTAVLPVTPSPASPAPFAAPETRQTVADASARTACLADAQARAFDRAGMHDKAARAHETAQAAALSSSVTDLQTLNPSPPEKFNSHLRAWCLKNLPDIKITQIKPARTPHRR